MKYIFLVLIFFCNSASAMDGEMSVGYTHFGQQENGYWYQDGFNKNLRMDSPSIALGITDYLAPSIRYHFGYKYLGNVRTSAWCMGSDALYAQYQKTGINPLKLGLFNGYGSVNMLYLTIAPEYHYGNWTFSVEAGATIYRPTWIEQGINFQETIGGNLRSYEWTYHPKMHTGGTIGVSVKYKDVEVVISAYDIDGKDDVQAVYHGIATNLSMRKIF